MISPTFEHELREQLNTLSADQQRRVLEFAQSLAAAPPKGTPGQELLRFAGTIEADDLALIAQAIEDDCERIDHGEW